MYKIIFYVGLVLALFFTVISMILFVKNNVAKLIGDVTGWNARKAIKKIHEKEAEHKLQTKDSSKALTDTAKSSEERVLTEGETTLLSVDEETTLLTEEETTLLSVDEGTTLLTEEETTLLSVDEETTLLTEEETTLLSVDEETTLLTEEETTLLTAELPRKQEDNPATDGRGEEDVSVEDFFQIEEDIVITHTEERIDQ